MFCCPAFEHLIKSAGQYGYSALVVEDSDHRIRFVLQTRMADKEQLDLWFARLGDKAPLSINFALVRQFAMNYCPICGTPLQELVEGARTKFSALAKDHDQYFLGPRF